MPIQLYAFDTPNGRKISVALEEMGLPYEVHVVDITQGEQTAPDFLKISPNNKIPAIVDPDGPGGQPISVFESGAILIYLAKKTGKFLPKDPRARVAVFEWLMFQMGGFGPMPGQVHHFAGLESDADRRYGLERFMAETRRLYGVMDRRLADNAFFAGEEISIADFAIVGWVWRHERHKIDLADFPHVQRWYRVMMARSGVERGFGVPAKQAVMPEAQLTCKGKGIVATGYEGTQGFVVKAGSQAVAEAVPSMQLHVRGMYDTRQELIANGVLVPESASPGRAYRLTQDYVFSSPSTAAAVLLGRSANGRIEWKDALGRTLKELQALEAGM